MIVKFFLRNFIFLLFLLNISKQEEVEVEVPYKNPYKDILNNIKIETRAFYEKLQHCVKEALIDIPVAGTKEIEHLCIGENFVILNKIHQTKVDEVEKIYEEMLWKEFEHNIEQDEEVVIYFIDSFKLLLKKGYNQLYQSMEIIQLGCKYFVEEKTFKILLDISRNMLEFISKFHLSFSQEKLDIRNYIKEELVERDQNLEAILRQGITGETLDEAMANLTIKKPDTLADQINDMNDKIDGDVKAFIDEEEEEGNNETGDVPEDFGMKSGNQGKADGFLDFADDMDEGNSDGGNQEQEDYEAESGEEGNKIEMEDFHGENFYDENEEADTSEPPLNLVDDFAQSGREHMYTNYIY